MPEVQNITHGNKDILLIDLSGISGYRALPGLIDKAIRIAQSGECPGTVRTLIDLSGTRINNEVASSLKRLSQNNGRYAKATAFVGLNTAWSIILSLVFLVRRKRNHKVFAARSDALKWLEQW